MANYKKVGVFNVLINEKRMMNVLQNEDLILKKNDLEKVFYTFFEASSKHGISSAEGTAGCLDSKEGTETSRCSVGS